MQEQGLMLVRVLEIKVSSAKYRDFQISPDLYPLCLQEQNMEL